MYIEWIIKQEVQVHYHLVGGMINIKNKLFYLWFIGLYIDKINQNILFSYS